MFERFRRWLGGNFICQGCGRAFTILTFGFGKGICPDCYSGEQPFLFFDKSYFLNRVLACLLGGTSEGVPPKR